MTNPGHLPFDDGCSEHPSRPGPALPSLADSDRKLLAFTRLWTLHQSSVRAYLASFLGNSIAVDDALQEVALVVWRKGPCDEDASAFLRYSLGCARRIALAARRKQGAVWLELLSPEAATALADRVAFLEQQSVPNPERMHTLRRCLEKLQPEHRELLEFRYSGESKEELRGLSKRVGKSMEALYKTLERLRDVLRSCVERSQRPDA
jgi:RNA polymerase sigma-70 factor, ECF subfamily